jgi:hypothetical protein
MAINAIKSSQEKELFPEGAYPARVYQVIHIGTVVGWEGGLYNKALITFEFPTEKKVFDEKKGEQPRVLSTKVTLSTHEKSGLLKIIKACDPKAEYEDGTYNVENLIGKTCLATVKHKEKKDGTGKYALIDNFTVLPKGMDCPEQINPSKVLSYEAFDWTSFYALPDFIKNEMKTSKEFLQLENPGAYPTENNNPEDVPF